MNPVIIFEELRLPLELLSASLVFFLPFGKKKPGFALKAILAYTATLLLSLLYFPIFGSKEAPRYHFLTVFWYAFLAFLPVCHARLLFVISWCDALFLGISAFLSQNIIYCIYHCCLARVIFPTLRKHLLVYVLGAILITVIVLFPLYLLFRAWLRLCHGRIFTDSRFVFCSLLGSWIATLTCLFFYQGAFEYRISLYDSLAWLSGTILCLLFLLIQYSILRASLSMRETAALENLLKAREENYALTKEHIQTINRCCHDLKHQLAALKMASEAEREEYIAEAEKSLDIYQSHIYTENEALNTILAEKGLLCKEQGITFRCSVDEADLSFLRLPDLYALLGNAIDNAMEYVSGKEDPSQRMISLRITTRNQFLSLQVLNPYTGAALSPGILPRSTKDHPEDHGFGLKSIVYLAKKYKGSAQWSSEGGLFTLQILLPIP